MISHISLDVTDTFEVIDTLGQLNESEAIFSHLAKYLARYGFTSFLVSGLPAQRERLEPHILLNGWPTGWFEHYTAMNHYRHDPCVRHCFSTIEPFAWDEMPARLLEEPEARVVMEEAAEFGLAEGLCIPLHDVYGSRVITVAGQHLDVAPSARRMVHLTSLYAYGAAERAIRKPTYYKGVSRLTERERDVMRWTAEGKTFWEIGKILGISEATVNDHMRNIRVKLGTRNTTHSLAEALRRKELRL
ncbi:helix-turn-helix transcriptional regulator [Chelativorans sp. YIM 93263]|uniref:helix-turn-helix transcriptional regulator n=1 Tax=Chelativorans sp. YIM 93263 TaxID=2906648 RepID=UPI0023788B7D|nr:LuxR family transcriptional regulator [Chelativorans sp. YIM 93263]